MFTFNFLSKKKKKTYFMNNENKKLNSIICKCGSISCSKIRIVSFLTRLPNNSRCDYDQFYYSILHHKSLYLNNTKSIIVDKCCNNCIFFHCSECCEHFSIQKVHNLKNKFLIGFNSNCLTHFERPKSIKKVIVPEFPIVLNSFVSLLEQKKKENCIENSKILSNTKSLNDFVFDENENENSNEIENDSEILSFDSDEDLMFGNQQYDLIIGKYNEHYI